MEGALTMVQGDAPAEEMRQCGGADRLPLAAGRLPARQGKEIA